MMLTSNLAGTEAIRERLLRIGDRMAKRALQATAEDVEAMVGHDAGKHTKTGALFRSVHAHPAGSDAWEVGHDLQIAPYALFVHWGTRRHKIKPKDKKTLRFPMGGKFAFAREVDHPGYKGDPWIVRAAAEAPHIFERHVAALLTNT